MSDQYDYASELSSYSNRLNTFKTDASSSAAKVGQGARTAIGGLSAPLGIGLVKDGVKSIVDSGKAVARKTLKDAASRLQSKATSALEEAKGQVRDAVQGAKDTVRDATNSARSAVQDAQSAVRGGVQGVQDAATDVSQVSQAAAVGNGEVAMEPVAAAVGRSAISNAFTNADVGAMNAAQKTSYLQAFQGEPITDIGNLPEGAIEHALAARASSISKGIMTANEGEDLAPVASVARGPMLGGLRGDSTIARALAPRAPPPAPVPDEPPIIPAVTRAVDGSSEDAITPGVGDEVQAAGSAAKAAAKVGEGVAEKTAGEDVVDTGEAVALSTGAETGGIGTLVGGLLAVGGAIAAAVAPHKKPMVSKSLAMPSIQLGL